MWSHYGDKHKGICIEFDRPDKDFLDVIYSKNRFKFNLEDTTRRMLGYMLSNEQVDVNDIRLIKCVSKPFIVKSLDWKYEEEVRRILSTTTEDVIIKNDLMLFNMPTKITKIFVGCKVDTNSKEYKNFVDIASQLNVKVVKLTESNQTFSLEIKGGVNYD